MTLSQPTLLLDVWYVWVPFWGRHCWISAHSQCPLLPCSHTLSDQVSHGSVFRGEDNETGEYAIGTTETQLGVFDNIIKQFNPLSPEPPIVLMSQNMKWQFFLSFLVIWVRSPLLTAKNILSLPFPHLNLSRLELFFPVSPYNVVWWKTQKPHPYNIYNNTDYVHSYAEQLWEVGVSMNSIL